MIQRRQPKGTPTGGQFAGRTRDEAEGYLVTGDEMDANEWRIAALRSRDELNTAEAELEAARVAYEEADRRYAELLARDEVLQTQGESLGLRLADPARPAPPTGTEADTSSENPTSARVVTSENSFVQRGGVADNVVSPDGTIFHRRRDDVYPREPYRMRFQADRPLSDEEMQHLAQLIGYEYRASVRGEPMGAPERDSPYSFMVFADTTKSSSDDLGMALERFEEGLPTTVTQGSPLRSTNRSGPGTKGTRLVEPFGDVHLEVYYDDVYYTSDDVHYT